MAELLRQAGDTSFYQLLAVGTAATDQQVHEGYERTARLVHPDNADRLGLAGREGVLDVLFERVTEAYLTLNEPERRKAYDRELGPVLWAGDSPRRSREQENMERARSYFERAGTLAAQSEFHLAIELLKEAGRIHPRAEYFALLGELQAKNVNWLHHAAESLNRALELGGTNWEIESALKRVREEIAGGGRRDSESEESDVILR